MPGPRHRLRRPRPGRGRRGCRVTAVDLSRRALATAWLNAHLHRLPVHLRRGDLTAPVPASDGRFDLVLSNPPYVPAGSARAPAAGRPSPGTRPDGRLLLDRLCRQVPPLLAPGGGAAAGAVLAGRTRRHRPPVACRRAPGERRRAEVAGVRPGDDRPGRNGSSAPA
ncbi:methyltransferase [Kitasatospora cheerisanensis KCTC 2395]|uniref:Methyltransferase n=1 Tax=Kitasatospora cheerisanensis KCTC 2395 TaxID=1348663 RepID=A0A066ZB89_9ACTN|nr:methyltransferase [Kitasatospora cheerisanensis KCTC 2395]